MINRYILHYSTAECSWLRLAAGCAMLKICEQKGVGDVYTVDQFYNLSQLAMDDVKQVRELFISKLHKVNEISTSVFFYFFNWVDPKCSYINYDSL